MKFKVAFAIFAIFAIFAVVAIAACLGVGTLLMDLHHYLTK